MVLVGVACAFAGLCYAEMASAVPVAGSAYTYSYATMGEFAAWIIGWDLVLEYAAGAATVGVGWSATSCLCSACSACTFREPHGSAHSAVHGHAGGRARGGMRPPGTEPDRRDH